MTRREALETYARAVQGKAKADQLVSIVRRFLAAQVPWTRAGITGYAQRLLAEGKAPSTVDEHLRVLRAFGRRVGLDWPGCDWSWDREEQPSQQVAASPEFVAALVRARGVSRRVGAWIALSAVYGCRAGELAAWSASCVSGERIFIRRLKGGESRWYWLPPEVRRRVEGAVMRPLDRRETYAAWRQACAAAGLAVPKGVAWHAVRYALIVGLQSAGVPGDAIGRFLSWSRNQPKMLRHYTQPTAVLDAAGHVRGLTRGQAIPPAPDADSLRRLDAAVWAKHPFLGLFR